MPYDELLRLSGSTDTPTETVTSTGNGTGRYFGKSRAFRAALRIAGAVGGTNPTLDVILQASSDAAFTSPVTIGTFPQQTATDIEGEGEPEDVDDPTSVNIAYIAAATPSDKGYVRAVYTIGGTSSPSFAGVSVLCDALIGAVFA